MLNKMKILQKSTGISLYIWILLTILPFYFIFHSSTTMEVVTGIILTSLFFLFFRFAYISKSWGSYVWLSLLIAISITATNLFSYVYFAFFLAYFIGNIKKKVPFFTFYIVHLVLTSASINYKIIVKDPLLLKQWPFVFIIWFSIILLPLTIRTRKEKGQLEEKLDIANKRILELSKLEERQRIARDLHDTLGQKLSLIGLKSDLARKIIYKDPEQAKIELKDIQQTSRTALNEVRKMVSEMRGIKLKEEMHRVQQILDAAQIQLMIKEQITQTKLSSIAENILSMCLKEAVTNVVKHSGATVCTFSITATTTEVIMTIKDNGKTMKNDQDYHLSGNGLIGMRERLEFVNGRMDIFYKHGTVLTITIPFDGKLQAKEEIK